MLAELDPVPFQTDVDSAEADVAQAQAQFDKLRRGFRVEEVAQARATVAQRAADVENARVTLSGSSSWWPRVWSRTSRSTTRRRGCT